MNFTVKWGIIVLFSYDTPSLSLYIPTLKRLSENEKPKKIFIGSKGLMTRKFAKMSILEHPVKRRYDTSDLPPDYA